MLPTSRILRPAVTLAALAAVAASAPAAGAATTHAHRCEAGSIHAGKAHTTVCDRHGQRIAVATDGGTTLAVQTAQHGVAPARCALGDGSVRRGTTVVTITRVVSATTGKTLERSTDAEICADDSTFHPVADPLVVLGLISTSTIIDRTEIR